MQMLIDALMVQNKLWKAASFYTSNNQDCKDNKIRIFYFYNGRKWLLWQKENKNLDLLLYLKGI